MVLSTLLQNRMVLSLLHQSCLILALFLSLQNCMVLSLLQNHMDLYLSTCFRTSWFSHLLQSRVVSFPFTLEPRGLLSSMAAGPRFKSQCPSSFAVPFLTPPTVSYTCQHPCILPALLGCHSKSGQVWPHGMEPIFSKLSCRLCNQGELLPSYILGGSHSHPPGSKHAHSYLTYL